MRPLKLVFTSRLLPLSCFKRIFMAMPRTLCWLRLISIYNCFNGNSSPNQHGHWRFRFDFYDAMHHRMLRTMYCKLSRCQVCPRVGSHWEAGGGSVESHAAPMGGCNPKSPICHEWCIIWYYMIVYVAIYCSNHIIESYCILLYYTIFLHTITTQYYYTFHIISLYYYIDIYIIMHNVFTTLIQNIYECTTTIYYS